MFVGGGGDYYPAVSGNSYHVKQLPVQATSTSGYTAEQVEEFFESLDPDAMSQAGAAHLAAAGSLRDVAKQAVAHAHAVASNMDGKSATAAIGALRQLHNTAAQLAESSHQTGHVLTTLAPVLSSYQGWKAPSAQLSQAQQQMVEHDPSGLQSIVTGLQQARTQAAQQKLHELNVQLVAANEALPTTITVNPPKPKPKPPAGGGGGVAAGGGGGVAGGGGGGVGGAGGGGAGVPPVVTGAPGGGQVPAPPGGISVSQVPGPLPTAPGPGPVTPIPSPGPAPSPLPTPVPVAPAPGPDPLQPGPAGRAPSPLDPDTPNPADPFAPDPYLPAPATASVPGGGGVPGGTSPGPDGDFGPGVTGDGPGGAFGDAPGGGFGDVPGGGFGGGSFGGGGSFMPGGGGQAGGGFTEGGGFSHPGLGDSVADGLVPDGAVPPGESAVMGADGMIGLPANPAGAAGGYGTGYGMPAGGAAGRGEDQPGRHRESWMNEDAEVWTGGTQVTPALIGR